MPHYFTNDPYAMRPPGLGGRLTFVSKETSQSGDPNNPQWNIEDTWDGHPDTVLDARARPAAYFPGYKNVRTVEEGPIWKCIVEYGNIDLLSTWSLDSNMIEPRLSTAPSAIALDAARPGWTRFIEFKVEEHFNSTPEAAFNFESIKSAGLNGTINAVQGYNVPQLDGYAEEYARAWILGQEAFLEPQWVIRNEVTVSAAFNFSFWPGLFQYVNQMLTPTKMRFEGILSGEVIPAGVIVPGVPYWHKMPIQKRQTSKNQFIINREWWGRYWFNPFTYSIAT